MESYGVKYDNFRVILMLNRIICKPFVVKYNNLEEFLYRDRNKCIANDRIQVLADIYRLVLIY